jgi:SPP1 family predicted phage head-tail adaptor
MLLGDLRHLLTIQTDEGSARNSVGERVESWQAWGQAWASIEPLTGREIEDALQIAPRVTTRVTLRYQAGIHAGMRLVREDGGILHVEAVLNEGMANDVLVLLAREAP